MVKNNTNKEANNTPSQKSPKNESKSKYKIRNWSKYNKSLIKRGDLTVFISDDVQFLCTDNHTPKQSKEPKEQGRPPKYSDRLIELCCTVRQIFHLPFRQTEGFVEFLFKSMGIDIPVPCYPQICRRMKQLDIKLDIGKRCNRKEPLVVAVDSTGLKVCGEGEWKVRQHGYSKRRTWRKMHLFVNTETGEIVSTGMTECKIDDAEMVRPLLEQIPDDVKIDALIGDGAYDKQKVYDILKRRGIIAIIPPRKDARIVRHGNCKGEPHPRDENLRYIRKKGRKRWKEKVDYYRRNIVETTMFRYKTMFSGHLRSREEKRQKVEVKLNCKILNQMTSYGMPITEKIT